VSTPVGGHSYHSQERISTGAVLRWALAANGVLLVVQVVGALLFGSLALLADTAHQGSDVVALMVASIALSLSGRGDGGSPERCLTDSCCWLDNRGGCEANQRPPRGFWLGGVHGGCRWALCERWQRLVAPAQRQPEHEHLRCCTSPAR